ncbi:L-2-hydroxyglutarate oxidase [Roseivirga pacifica]|uniref:L-2-hydroxyglutarate oxidase n=1 Tax=Roseivirga pacifica TaxID=1267423 RepID=UPI00209443E4|nr:L-2-hydroxyglutarate oxidase [Roseivirga pacifica]MCO6358421.1 L-2-hydroxyglutarate oxidase [Roseivirga pacifica]MCO6368976.1 L-2-hydroxyglutarate oxidase [Roseivirga pacifica]MCO6372320.1 L-2-hydroxyglutarate oxidase [Roseivirga pacifica]MCO6374152.1 L-2-hydroxyglutarate oxidase [Roseivirga pacifica]MCO6381051.1 L-2-hydroxyglutarate oxidase [Roseivirga pacifica]
MKYDIVVIGGGIVGLATAYQTLKKKPSLKLALVEKETELCKHQTGNNSGVIHSGLYYKPGSLKAKNCIGGYQMLLDFCNENEIPYELCGKVVVATDEFQKPLLENLYKRGLENGLDKISKLSMEALREIEPHVNGIAALNVPYTGIIDYVAVAHKYAELIQAFGGDIFLGEKVTGIKQSTGSATVITEKQSLETSLVINCGGLYSDKLARQTSEEVDLKIIPFRGEYFKLKPEKEYLVKHLIYPVPDPNFPFLGVHFTRMINGGIEAGPNAVLAFRREGYKKSQIHLGELAESLMWPGFQKVAMKYWKTGFGEMYRSFSKVAFTKALQKLIPEIEENDLVDGGAGVRAQACDRTGGLLDDFAIIEADKAINVCNAPSPAATSSLSIGNTVSSLAIERF